MEIAQQTARPIAEKTRGSVPAQLMIKDATPQTLVSQCSQLATIPAFNAKTTVNPNVDLRKYSARVQLIISGVNKSEVVTL